MGQGAPWWVREIHADHAYKEGFYLKRGDGKGGKGAAVGETGLWGQEPCKERERQREREKQRPVSSGGGPAQCLNANSLPHTQICLWPVLFSLFFLTPVKPLKFLYILQECHENLTTRHFFCA